MSNICPLAPLDVASAEDKPNKESYLMDAEGDGVNLVKDTLTLKYCPLHHLCAAGPWSGHQPWTFIDPEDPDKAFHTCIGYLKYHLRCSGKHNIPPHEINDMIQDWVDNDKLVWIRNICTWQDREFYRGQVAAANYAKQAHREHQHNKRRRVAKGKGKGKAAEVAEVADVEEDDGDDDASEANVDVVSSLVPSLQHAGTPDAMRQALLRILGFQDHEQLQIQMLNQRAIVPVVPARARPGDTVRVSIAQLRTVRESIRRAEHATGNLLAAIVTAGKVIRTENEILTQNRTEVDMLIQQGSSQQGSSSGHR